VATRKAMGSLDAQKHMTTKDFFKGKKVLVTGHTGFKGAWLAQTLVECGAYVSGFSLPPDTHPNLFALLNLKKHIKNYFGDIRDLEEVRSCVRECAPDIIMHLAAQAIVRKGYDDPMFTFSTNVGGTVNILEVAREMKTVRAVVVVTSDKVYTNLEDGRAYKENDALGGGDPYSASKAAADIATQSYVSAFFDPRMFKKAHETLVGIARAGNVIGGGDWAPDRLLPDFIRSVYENGGSMLVRNPQAVRPWQHVLEVVSGYLLLAKYLYEGRTDAAGAWNFGPDASGLLSVADVLKKSCAMLGRGQYTIVPDQTKPEARTLVLDAEKARMMLGWYPQWTIDGALERTLVWYKKYYSGESALSLTQKQINEFFI